MKTRQHIMVIIALTITRIVVGYAAQIPEPRLMQLGFQAIGAVLSLAIALMIIVTLWRIVRPFINDLFSESTEEQPEEAAKQTIKSITETLDDAKQNSHRAGEKIADAQVQAAHLVRLVQVITLKADDMLEEAMVLGRALDAIQGGNWLEIARVAGEVRDEQIRDLMLTRTTGETYWLNVSRMIATQLGTLNQWSSGYYKFSDQLFTSVSTAKSQLIAARAALELTEVSQPISQIEANLNEVAGHLKLEQRPGLRDFAKTVPALGSGE